MQVKPVANRTNSKFLQDRFFIGENLGNKMLVFKEGALEAA